MPTADTGNGSETDGPRLVLSGVAALSGCSIRIGHHCYIHVPVKKGLRMEEYPGAQTVGRCSRVFLHNHLTLVPSSRGTARAAPASQRLDWRLGVRVSDVGWEEGGSHDHLSMDV